MRKNTIKNLKRDKAKQQTKDNTNEISKRDPDEDYLAFCSCRRMSTRHRNGKCLYCGD